MRGDYTKSQELLMYQSVNDFMSRIIYNLYIKKHFKPLCKKSIFIEKLFYCFFFPKKIKPAQYN